MYSLMYSIFFALSRKMRKRTEERKQESKIIKKLLGYCEWYYNIWVARWYMARPCHKLGVTKHKRAKKIIVSLTSFPKRINDVWLTIETLLRQSVKPDEIVLWLADTQFNNGLSGLPEKLLRLQNYGLTICFCDDLKSHKKYYYTMQKYPEDIVILVDDDAFYPRDLIKKLLQLHRENPNDIVCMTPAMITSVCDPPSKWRAPRSDERVVHSYFAQPYTGQGTLYPPHSLDENNAFNKNQIMKLCPYADDLWLKFMSMRKGTLVTAIYKYRDIPVNIYGTAEGSLYYINGEGAQNDVQWKNLLEHYGTLPDHCGVAAESEIKIEEHSRKDI